MSFAVALKRRTIIMSYKHRLAHTGTEGSLKLGLPQTLLFYSVYNERADVSF